MIRKHTLIIGGTKGIGRALVRTLEKEGHILSVIGRNIPDSGDNSERISYHAVDVNVREDLNSVLEKIVSEKGKLNHLVCLQRYRGKEDDWTGDMETTVNSTKYIIDSLVDHFDTSADCSIVLANSIVSKMVVENQPLSYHIAKSAIDQLIRYYAVVLGRKGIRVNGISPGTVLKDESKKYFLSKQALYDFYRDIIPLGRMGTAEEVSDVIAFLCSSKSSFVTGQTITIDGGLSLQWQESLALRMAPPADKS